ncbi:MAG TPA: YcaO-like family protein, partial [Gammaproteobacteria bacterium]|nr:YcaO-like family protein [Gammaproteobacteria bacterium]
KQNHFFSRGTGSGYTLVEAIEKALIEGLQIRQQFLNNSAVQGCTIYDNWRKPEVIDQIQTYLEKLYRLSFFEHPLHSVEYTPSLLLEEIKENLKIKKKPLLVADLPCSIEGWFAVRVLIPGFATHQYPSESRGGKKIINPIFMYGVPT